MSGNADAIQAPRKGEPWVPVGHLDAPPEVSRAGQECLLCSLLEVRVVPLLHFVCQQGQVCLLRTACQLRMKHFCLLKSSPLQWYSINSIHRGQVGGRARRWSHGIEGDVQLPSHSMEEWANTQVIRRGAKTGRRLVQANEVQGKVKQIA